MAKDLIYYYEKKKTHNVGAYSFGYEQKVLGEVQQDFNMGLVIDGTKDSVHFQVVSYSKVRLDPYTIIFHNATQTWWIVSHDKVMRYANESGYMYVHELDLLGAIELLNARDLTDCGFRSNRYTIDDFTKRLFKLSNFELPMAYYYGNLDSSQKVDYLKTFENYTLLSAIREFFNGYNAVSKLVFSTFTTGGKTYIVGANLLIYSKTGNTNLDILDMEDFTDVRETRTIDKNSFGGKVITNAENVVSTRTSLYPAVGTTMLKSNEKDVTGDSAVIKLPSNVYKAVKLRLCAINFSIGAVMAGLTMYEKVNSDAYNSVSMSDAFDKIIQRIEANVSITSPDTLDLIRAAKEEFLSQVILATTFDFYDGFLYDAMTEKYKYPLNAPSDMKIIKGVNIGGTSRDLVFTDKVTRESLARPYEGIYWERGSNEIKGFEYLNAPSPTDVKMLYISTSRFGNGTFISVDTPDGTCEFFIADGHSNQYRDKLYINYNKEYPHYIVEYIPMSDLKLERDNENKTFDIQLYNQSGRMNDSVALSKLINSYAEEITTDNVVRYCDYYSFDDVPQVGQIVNDNGTYYIINNVSLDFYQNDQTDGNVSYFMSCEFTMSKQVAVKSLMVNANSNIRDYGIPQKNNVERKQIYNDIFYLSNVMLPYEKPIILDLNKTLSFPNVPISPKEYMAFIKVDGTFPVYGGGSDTPTSTMDHTYYQLPVVRFQFKKNIVYKVNFNDNNIIGYDSQSIASGWTPANFFSIAKRLINTPISYVDENGELDGITIQFVDTEKTGEVYVDYATDKGYTQVDLFSGSVYLDESGEIYGLALNESSFEIEALDYNKDAIEVPIFEYSCQLINSKDVLVGEKIFEPCDEVSSYRLFYGFAYTDDYVTENNALDYATNEITAYFNSALDFGWKLTNGCSITIDGVGILSIKLLDELKIRGAIFVEGNQVTPQANKQIIIYRYVFDITTGKTIRKDMLFVIRKTNVENNKIVCYVQNKE